METLTERMRALGDARKYTEQGELFLKETGSTLEVVEAMPQKTAPWSKETNAKAAPIHYACKLSNKHGAYSFDFWGSISEAEKVVNAFPGNARKHAREAVKPNAYSILTALHDSAGDDFADFCSIYGYDEDSRTAERIYNAVIDQERNMRKLYDRAELEALNEIS